MAVDDFRMKQRVESLLNFHNIEAIKNSTERQRVEPALNSKFNFHNVGAQNEELFRQLNQDITDGACPVEQYEGVDYNVYAANTSDEFDDLKESIEVPEDGMVAIIYHPGAGGILTTAEEGKRKTHFIYGTRFKELLQSILTQSNDREVSLGLDELLGYQYVSKLEEMLADDNKTIEDWEMAKGILKLSFITNSFSSCATYLYEEMKLKGYFFNKLSELIDKVIPVNLIDGLMQSIKDGAESAEKPEAMEFFDEGQKKVDEMLHLFDGAMKYMPGAQFLFQYFWEKFNTSLATHKNMFSYLLRMSKAKMDFESNMAKSLGTEAMNQILGKEGKKIFDHGGKYAELLLGGGLFGSIPFLIGTVYQIIYDIVNVVYSLFWYGYKGAEGILSWLFTSPSEEDKDKIAADDSLMQMLTFDFNAEKLLTNDLPNILNLFVEFTGKLVESFLNNAAEYGQIIGKLLGKGLVKIGEGALRLMTKGYPKKPTLLNRFTWSVKKWFNIGCLIGPIAVDIALMFCSAGTSGVFSAAAKLNKLGKLGDFARFAGGSGKLLEKTKLFGKVSKLIPRKLKDMVEVLIHQLWAIGSNIKDIFKTLLSWANKGNVLSPDDLLKLGNKLDSWYNIASFANLFAALAFMFLGGESAKVNKEGKVIAT